MLSELTSKLTTLIRDYMFNEELVAQLLKNNLVLHISYTN